ncbi:MAG: TonB family protein, partial [Woeseia sp.]|nr:TonB family protein [Woeseia sp.]NNL54890.1 TonB family protein [Woeseia sp.]
STLPGITPAAIEPLVDDLAAARGAQQVDELLALANLRLAENRLTSPANDNARYFFELAAVAAPDEPAVQQGLQVVASRLVLNARIALDSGDLATAKQLLAEARTLDAESQQLRATDRALRELETSQAETAQQESTRRVAPNQESSDAASLQSRPAATVDNRDESTRPANADAPPQNDVAAELETSAATGTATVANAASVATLADTKPAAVPNDETPPVPGDVRTEPAQSTPTSSEPEWATMGQLTRRNYVAPLYPRNAQRRNISGWVSVGFTVTPGGSVSDLEIIDSMPGKTFNEAALKAVGQWRFEPIIENGRPVAKRVAVKMRFDLQ